MNPADIPPEEFLYISSWERLAREKGYPYLATQEVASFFSNPIPPGTTLVTACSDYSVRDQQAHHPNGDLYKQSLAFPWEEVAPPGGKYHAVKIGPACEAKGCDPSDPYCLKVDRWTYCTFREVPAGLDRWWTVNLDVDLPRTSLLPFGLNDHGEGASLLPSRRGLPKKRLLYVNFQDHTLERIKLKSFFSTQPWATTRQQVGLPVGDFLGELSSHQFVLCPHGNGLDCYRTYESLYLGSVPILPDGVFGRKLLELGLPVVLCQDFYRLTPAMLQQVWEDYQIQYSSSCEALTLSYWREIL